MAKKLLITTDSFLPRWDGVARFLSDIIPRLSEEYEVTVVAPKFKGDAPDFRRITIIRIPLINWQISDIYFSKPKYKAIKDLVRKSDIIFNQTIGPIGALAVKAAKKLKKPVVSFAHSIEWELTSKSVKRFKRLVYHLTKWLARKLYNKCSLIIVPTKEVKHILYRAGIKTKKVVVSLGVNIAKFMPPIDKNAAKRNVDLDPDKIIIGTCGRIGREKDLPTLKKAFTELRKQYPDIQLLIVGGGPKDQIEELKGSDIILAGPKDDVIPYLQAMDIFVLTSLTETTSLATMEAMAAGLAIVSTPVGYVKEYITKYKNGFFFPKKSADGLKERLEELIKDKKLRERLGRNARKSMISEHRWHYTVKGILAALDEVLKKES